MIAALALAALASVPVAHRKVVAADGYALALYRYGEPSIERPPVLLVPELGMGRQAFDYEGDGLARFLAEHGVQVYVAELRGQGVSGVPRAGYHLRDVARDVVTVVKAIGAPQIDLVVHGWSGTLALAATVELGGQVRRVVALSTPAIPDVPSSLVKGLLEEGGHFASLGSDPERSRMFDLVFTMGGRYRRGKMEGLRSDAFSDLGTVAARELLEWMTSGDLALHGEFRVSDRLHAYDRPTMLFLGLADGFASPELSSPLREVTKAKVKMKAFSRFEFVSEDYSHLSMLHGEFARREIYQPALEFLR